MRDFILVKDLQNAVAKTEIFKIATDFHSVCANSMNESLDSSLEMKVQVISPTSIILVRFFSPKILTFLIFYFLFLSTTFPYSLIPQFLLHFFFLLIILSIPALHLIWFFNYILPISFSVSPFTAPSLFCIHFTLFPHLPESLCSSFSKHFLFPPLYNLL